MKICQKLTAELCPFFLTTYRLFELISNSRSPSSRINFTAADSNGGCGTQRPKSQRYHYQLLVNDFNIHSRTALGGAERGLWRGAVKARRGGEEMIERLDAR